MPQWVLNLWNAIWNAIVSYLVPLALVGSGAIAVSLYRTVRKATGPMAPLIIGYLFVFLFVVILVTFNQLQDIQDRKQRARLVQRTPAQLVGEIPSWLYQSGFTITNDPQPNVEFHFIAQDPTQRRISIGQIRGDPYISLSTQLVIQPEQYARIDRLVPRPDAPFALDLVIAVSKLGLVYDGIGYPLRVITLTEKLPFNDTLTQFTFLDGFLRIRHGLIVVRSMILRAIQTGSG